MRNSQSGNVLFLILIAVALFAALSFAVTQTSQNSGAGSQGESNKVNFSVLMNYVTSIRATIERQRLDGNVNMSIYEASISDQCSATPERCIFTYVPYYDKDKSNARFKMNIQDVRARPHWDYANNRVHAFIHYSPVDQDVCESLNRYMQVDEEAKVINDQYDYDAILDTDNLPTVQCFYA